MFEIELKLKLETKQKYPFYINREITAQFHLSKWKSYFDSNNFIHQHSHPTFGIKLLCRYVIGIGIGIGVGIVVRNWNEIARRQIESASWRQPVGQWQINIIHVCFGIGGFVRVYVMNGKWNWTRNKSKRTKKMQSNVMCCVYGVVCFMWWKAKNWRINLNNHNSVRYSIPVLWFTDLTYLL